MSKQDRRPRGNPGKTPEDPGKAGPGTGGPDKGGPDKGGNEPARPNGPPGDGGGAGDGGPATGVVVKARPRTRKPTMYKVLMLNDDYTPMEFVVHVLERFFQKNRDEATRIMLHVHRRGVGVCGVFTYEVAETKVTQVMDLARQNQHPLQCTIEKE
ncbi:ATP-dependent Clp protease adapter ClpS [Roseomonas harenae]|jgi:ATP-dependent Clp protease adaptor protein ClpS|uniref:ATP-dependent Clp protease adapter ClpS n=1 Tax=Muricoccus harenae TaxID=2692566 RepID=UPI001F206512|nr:ATP-dependent Clp protease adapter ClpS [Roseomonas harenae]